MTDNSATVSGKAPADTKAAPGKEPEKAKPVTDAKPTAEKPAATKPAAAPKPAATKPAPKQAAGTKSAPPPPPRPVSRGFKSRARHFTIMLSFLIFAVTPSVGVWWYLTERAADQYASTVGFVVRQADNNAGPSAGILGNIATLGGNTNSDTDILYEFIKSQQMVESVDTKLNLRELYNKPENDPFFTLGDDASIEDLVWFWSWAVNVFYDPNTGLIELRVLAFTPEDSREVANEISAQSSALINELSDIAHDDTTRYARIELDKAVARLRETRQTLTEFRNTSQIVDPSADVQGRMGLLNYLQQQLADTMIEQDLLQNTTRQQDPRIKQTQRKIVVIQERIAEERQKIGLGDNGTGEAAAELVGKYEGLIVDREFAEQAYVNALSNYDTAIAEANRTSRYLAEYIKPTISQEAQYPQRYVIVALFALFMFLSWFILVLVYYSIKDRR